MIDVDGDGKIDCEEMMNVFGNGASGNQKGEDLWNEIIQGIDKDGDGLISFEEFSATMNDVIYKRTSFKEQ